MKKKNNYCIQEKYISRTEYAHHDDSSFKDEWQLEVYLHALGLMKKYNLKTVTDLGCGSGYKLMTYLKEYDTTGLELGINLEILNQKYPDRNWLESNFEVNHNINTDVLICSDVIEHIVNPDDLIHYLNKISFKYLVLSTPDRDLCYGLDSIYRNGPPKNQAHQREWTFNEFQDYISQYFDIVDHRITNMHQATQTMICTKKS